MLIKSASNTLIGHFVLPYRRRLFEQFYSGLSLLGRHISLLDKRAMLKWLELYKRKPIFCYFIPNQSKNQKKRIKESNILCLYGGGDGVCRINHLFLKAFISFDNNNDKQITQLGPLLVTIFTAQVLPAMQQFYVA
ncbi:hypothetical protein T09_988 [Trichinella sp. T9]|nr:hypothetical protein T09_988 [Trichinella sp. T9]